MAATAQAPSRKPKPQGRSQSKKSKRGKQRSDDLRNVWGRRASPLQYGDDEWQVIALRPGRQSLHIEDLVTSISWTDNGPMLTGTLSLQKDASHPTLDVGAGHVVRLEHRHLGHGPFREVWRMRLGASPDQGITVNAKDNSWEFPMADDLMLLAGSKSSFKVRKDKTNPKGVLTHVALERLCRQEGIPFRPFPTMKHRIKKLSMSNKSILDMLMQVLRQENTNEDKDYRLRWRLGRLEVVPQQRSEYMLEMADAIVDASLTLSRKEGFATELEVHATADDGVGKDSRGKKKSKKRKVKTTITSALSRRRYGRIKRSITVEASSVAEARRKGKRQLARLLRPKKEVTFTHPGIPGLRRQHALTIGIGTLRELVYVTSVTHTVSAGQYDMEVAVRFTDPFAQREKEKKEKAKRDAARRRKRAQKKAHDGERTRHPKPKTARQRGDSHDTSSSTPTDTRTPGEKLSDRGSV